MTKIFCDACEAVIDKTNSRVLEGRIRTKSGDVTLSVRMIIEFEDDKRFGKHEMRQSKSVIIARLTQCERMTNVKPAIPALSIC